MKTPGSRAAPFLCAAVLAGSAVAASGTGPAVGITTTATETGAPMSTRTEGSLTISPLQAVLTTEPAFPSVGQAVTVLLSVSNTGTAAVSALTAGIAVTSGTSHIGSLAGPLPAGPVAVRPSGGQVFTWTTSVTGAGGIRFTASATGTMDPAGGRVAAIATLAIRGHVLSNLTATISPNPLEVAGGEWFSLVMTVSNTGGVTATDVMPELSIYAGAPLASLKAGPEPAEPATLKPGQSERFVFTYSANGSGTISFSGTVTAKARMEKPGWISRKAADAAVKGRLMSKEAGKKGKELKKRVKLFLFPPKPPPPVEEALTSFESPGDLEWVTDGYVKITASGEHATDGDRSMRASFVLPSDLTFSPTGDWRPAIRLQTPARGSRLELGTRDWSRFTAFRADCHNAAAEPIDVTVRIVDRRGYQFEALRRLAPESSTTMEIPLSGPEEALLDLTRVREVGIAVDTAGLKGRPVLYLDNLRFALPPPPVAASATGFEFTGTSTGQPVEKP